MIATLTGRVAEKLGTVVVIECGGVGYGVLMTSSDHGNAVTGSELKVYIYENIKEDSHDLFGFTQLETRALFQQLLGVKNVGPKVALGVLDIGTGAMVRQAIASGDVKRLQTAKGVGKRAAEQIVVELRDKVGAIVGNDAEDIVNRGGVDQTDEALQALIALGYSDVDAVLALSDIEKDLPIEQRIKLALKGKR
jgi:Holliday junction DNA helicase RuvA